MKRKGGVVVEIAPKNKVIIMTSEGEFIRIPLKKNTCMWAKKSDTRLEKRALTSCRRGGL